MLRHSLLCALIVTAACTNDSPATDAGNGTIDAGRIDAGTFDAGSIDAGNGSIDAGSIDAGSTDAGSIDAGSIDAGSIDAGSIDAGTTDAGSTDAGSTDAGATDAGLTDAGAIASLSISPTTSELAPGASQVLTATLTGPAQTVTWATTGAGAISPQTGLIVTFTAPAAGGNGDISQITATAGTLKATAGVKLDPPLSTAILPLGAPVTTISRVADIEVIGVNTLSASNNLMAVAPSSGYGSISTDHLPAIGPAGSAGSQSDPQLLNQAVPAYANGLQKLAKAANLDTDAPEETVVLSWKPVATGTDAAALAAAIAHLTIIDPTPSTTGGDPTLTVLTPNLVDKIGAAMTLNVDPVCDGTGSAFVWETAGCTLDYDYDLALVDVDGDGTAEIVISGTVAGAAGLKNYNSTGRTFPVKRGKLWVFNNLKTSPKGTLQLRQTISLNGSSDPSSGSGASSGLYVARLAAGGMRADRTQQLALAWIDAKRWASAWSGCYPAVPGSGADICHGSQQVSYELFDAATLTQIGTERLTDPANKLLSQWSGSYVASNNVFGITMADVDGDGLQELVFGGINTLGFGYGAFQMALNLEVHDDLDHVNVAAGADAAALPLMTEGTPGYLDSCYPTIGCYGDGAMPARFLVPVNNFISAPNAANQGQQGSSNRRQAVILGNVLFSFALNGGTAISAVESQFVGQFAGFNFAAPNASTIVDIQAGDVNGDGSDDAMVLLADGSVQVYGYVCPDTSYQTGPCTGTPVWKEFYAYGPVSNATYFTSQAVLVPAAFDRNSLAVSFTPTLDGGAPAHSIIYKGAKIIALLESPAIQAGDGQSNTGNQTTSYGTGTTTSSSTGGAFSISAGITVGFDIELDVGFIVQTKLLEVKNTVSFEFQQTNTWETTSQKTIATTYNTYGGDLVVYSSTPYDRYVYTVVSSHNPAAVGHLMVVDVPQPTVISSCDRNYFNTVVNPGGAQVTHDLLPDTAGSLSTYPHYADIPTTAKGVQFGTVDVGNGLVLPSKITPWCNSALMAVGQGDTSTTSVSCDTSTTTSYSSSQTFGVTDTLEIGVSALVAGFNVGVSGTQSVGWSHTNSLSFEGVVGTIPQFYPDGGVDYQLNKYNWAITGYRQQLSDATGSVLQDFFVVGYAVDGFNGPP